MRARRAGTAAAGAPKFRSGRRLGRRWPGAVGHGGIVPYRARSPAPAQRGTRPNHAVEVVAVAVGAVPLLAVDVNRTKTDLTTTTGGTHTAAADTNHGATPNMTLDLRDLGAIQIDALREVSNM